MDLDQQAFPKDYHVPMTKIKGDLHFTIDKIEDASAPPGIATSGGGSGKNPLNLSPRAPRRLAAAIEKESEKKDAQATQAGANDKKAEWRKSVKVLVNIGFVIMLVLFFCWRIERKYNIANECAVGGGERCVAGHDIGRVAGARST